MRKPKSAGGWQAIRYVLKKSWQSGSMWRMWKALRSRNTCKTCALGMGGQQGGMVNEAGRSLEMCKKSIQAMAADMQGAIADDYFSTYTIAQLQQFSSYELEHAGRLSQPVIYEKHPTAASQGDDQHFRTIGWDDAYRRINQASAKLRQTTVSGISVAAVVTKRDSYCNSSHGCMAPTMSTTAAFTVTKPVASD